MPPLPSAGKPPFLGMQGPPKRQAQLGDFHPLSCMPRKSRLRARRPLARRHSPWLGRATPAERNPRASGSLPVVRRVFCRRSQRQVFAPSRVPRDNYCGRARLTSAMAWRGGLSAASRRWSAGPPNPPIAGPPTVANWMFSIMGSREMAPRPRSGPSTRGNLGPQTRRSGRGTVDCGACALSIAVIA